MSSPGKRLIPHGVSVTERGTPKITNSSLFIIFQKNQGFVGSLTEKGFCRLVENVLLLLFFPLVCTAKLR